jgi:hypothetical protein
MRFTKPPMRCHSLWYMMSCKYFIREIHHQILMLPLCMKYTRVIPDIYRKYTRNTPEIIPHHPRRNTPHLCQKYTRFIREESQPLSQVYTSSHPSSTTSWYRPLHCQQVKNHAWPGNVRHHQHQQPALRTPPSPRKEVPRGADTYAREPGELLIFKGMMHTEPLLSRRTSVPAPKVEAAKPQERGQDGATHPNCSINPILELQNPSIIAVQHLSKLWLIFPIAKRVCCGVRA